MIKTLFQLQRSYSVQRDSIICKGMKVVDHSLIKSTILAQGTKENHEIIRAVSNPADIQTRFLVF
jgi:hypothetical protein